MPVQYFTTADGLSHPFINTVLQDSRGFLWVGTQDGLNRYDGERFRIFRHDANNPHSLPGNFINNLYEDSDGMIWLSTVDHGICYYNPATERFLKINELDDFIGFSNQRILESKKGEIWIGTDDKLALLKTDKNSYECQILNIATSVILPLRDKNKSGIILVTKSNDFLKIENNNIDTLFSLPNISGILSVEYFQNKYWIATEAGLYYFNKNNGLSQYNLFRNSESEHYPKPFIYSVKKDKNNLWVASGSGLFLLKNSNKNLEKDTETIHLHKGLPAKYALSDNTVLSISIDNENVWVGTSNNLCRIDKNPQLFNNITLGNENSSLNPNTYSAALLTKEGLWLAIRNGGLYLIKGNKTYHYFKGTRKQDLEGNDLRTLELDSKGQLWIGSTSGLNICDLSNFNPKSPIFSKHKISVDLPNISETRQNNTRQILADQEGNMWVTTFTGGLFLIPHIPNNQHVEPISFIHDPKTPTSISSNAVHCIRQDEGGVFWIGTRYGLNKLKLSGDFFSNAAFEHFIHNKNDHTSIIGNAVYDLLVEKDKVWIGTSDGLSLYDKINQTFTSYSIADGLPSPVVNSILRDNNKRLWIATNGGLSIFDENKKQFTNYTRKDGLPTEAFEIFCKFKDSNGNLYFGGAGGMTYFNPEKINQLDREGKLIFTQIKIGEKILSPDNSEILNRTFEVTEKIKISHDQFPIIIQFADRDFHLNKNYNYHYQLLPQDKNWSALGDKTEIQILSLPPGEHILKVQGETRKNKWNQPPVEIRISVTPPWWKSNLAYIIYGLFSIGIIYSFFHFLYQQKAAKEESKRLRELDALKSKLYTNITHEFRTPLSVILGTADELKQQLGERHEKSMNVISRNGKQLLVLVNQMLDLSKLESGHMKLKLRQSDIISFLRYVCESFQSWAMREELRLVVYSEIEYWEMDFDDEKLATALSNLISNAIKFTPAGGQIVVHLNVKKDTLTIKVKDSGTGIPEYQLPHIFDRFFQVDDSSTRHHDGIGVGLALVKELVELMGGSVSAKSHLGKGSEFELNLPISNQSKPRENQALRNEPIVKTTISDARRKAPKGFANLPLALIVEDNSDVTDYLQNCLLGKYRTLEAPDGVAGMELAFSEVPDIVISDVMMPKMDGYELCQNLKSDERTNHIPIVLLTAKADFEDRLTGLSKGADAYLTKPFKKEELFARLEQLTVLRQRMREKFTRPATSTTHSDDPAARFVKKAQKIILAHLSDPEFGTAQLAAQIHLSESQLYRKLKAISGKSTALFIRSVRLSEAQELLFQTDRTISEIGYDVGFNTPSWFSRAFKEEYGISPNEFRQKKK